MPSWLLHQRKVLKSTAFSAYLYKLGSVEALGALAWSNVRFLLQDAGMEPFKVS